MNSGQKEILVRLKSLIWHIIVHWYALKMFEKEVVLG